ncbi:MAG: deoxynucleoside kinase [Syntrophobacteraceae bacterium]|jgi:deoxyadenosine/deoxycytidine kinase
MNRIEICGNIASGKTTLCRGLISKEFQPIFEDFQKNPFFEEFYKDPPAFSFETEVTFLLQHYHSIKIQKNNAQLVCDYSLLLDLAYADVNLAGDRHKIFCEMVAELQNEIGFPSQIINLMCPEEVLLQRIRARNREEETSITFDYLRALSKAISLRIKGILSQISVITIDSNAIDFTPGIEGIQELEPIKSIVTS